MESIDKKAQNIINTKNIEESEIKTRPPKALKGYMHSYNIKILNFRDRY